MFLLHPQILCAMILSLPFAVMDVKNRGIRPFWFPVSLVFSLIFARAMGRSLEAVLLSAVPGLLLTAVSRLSRGRLGMGDALFFLSLSGVLSFREMAELVGVSWVFCALFAFGRILSGNRKPLPYLAFIPPSLIWMAAKNIRL